MKPSLLAAGLASMALLGAAGASYGQSGLSRSAKSTISISTAKLSPKSMSGSGGQLTISSVKITSKGAAISNVAARIVIGSTRSSASTLRSAGNGVFTGTVNVPANTTGKTVTAKVELTVTAGNATATKVIGSVKLAKGSGSGPGPNPNPNPNDSTPPPPPRI